MPTLNESLQYFDDVIEFRGTLTPETDRGCALMAAAYLDVELEKLLAKFFVDDSSVVGELLGQSGPLGTFSSRINICYAVGLIGKKVHRDLHLIRKIRNDFAHKTGPLGFADQAIASRCSEFYSGGLSPGSDSRQHYTRTVLGVLAEIHWQMIQQKNLQPKEDLILSPELRAKHQELVTRVLAAVNSPPG
jgi:hypothetical protein